jgi:hypothetical protein
MHHDSQFFDAIVLIIQNWQGLNCCKCSHIKKSLFLNDFHDGVDDFTSIASNRLICIMAGAMVKNVFKTWF